MHSLQTMIEQLKKEGARITKARILMLEIFEKKHVPLSEAEIRQELFQRGCEVNKATIYRIAEYLISKQFIRNVDFGDGKKRYELNSGTHHHHLICTHCMKIEDIEMENDISQFEKKIGKQKKFTVMDHSLEFFGLCKACIKK